MAGYSSGYGSGYEDVGGHVLPVTPTGTPTPLADRWTFAAGPWQSLPIVEMADGVQRSVTWRLTGNHEASVTIVDDAARYAQLDTGPSPTVKKAPSTTTSVDVRIGYGNLHGAYATSDTSRMNQIPAQVALFASMPIDLFAAVECHEDGMDELLLTRIKASDPDWALGGGGSGNKLFYRPSVYFSVSGGNPVSMGGGRDASTFKVTHFTGLVVQVVIPHFRSNDTDGTPRDSERETETKWLAKHVAKMDNVIVCGDFNWKIKTEKKLRGILATSGLKGLQERFPGVPYGDRNSDDGSHNGRWIDDILTKSYQQVVAAAGVPAGDASDHYLFDQATVRFTTSSVVTAPTSQGPDVTSGGIKEMVWDLWVMRNGEALFRGRMGPSSDDGDSNGSVTSTFSAADYRELLGRRFLFEGDTVTFTNTDQSDIAWSLITSTQGKVGGDLGIVRGVGASTGQKPASWAAALGDNVGSAIASLAAVPTGFDWDIAPNLNDTSMTFDVYYPGRGTSRNVVLDYGGRVASFSRSVDPGSFGNAVRATGGGTLVPIRAESQGLAYDPAGRWDLQWSDDTVTVAKTLQDKAAKALADSQYVTPSWTVVLNPGAWNGPEDFWLGDTVTLVVKAGRLDVVETLRIFEFGLVLDENDLPTITVTLGAPDPKLRRSVRTINKRITALERR